MSLVLRERTPGTGRIAESREEFFVGLDLGQRRDHTALAVMERAEVKYHEINPVTYARRQEMLYRVRHLERAALGTAYPDVVARAGRVIQQLRPKGRCTLVVDATGVGGPVTDLLRDAQMECCLVPVLITGGELTNESKGYWHVPKQELLTGLQVMFQKGELQIAAELKDAARLVKELTNVRMTGAGSEHDDLVFAVALACWRGRVRSAPPVWGTRRLV